MSSTATDAAGRPADPGPTTLLRVSLSSDTRRVDLAVPGRVPLVEMLPEMLRTLGVLDAATVHAGYELTGPDGRQLSADIGLAGQGIRDGDQLRVVVGADQRPPRVYDDVIEAMSDAVEEQMTPWRPEASRRTALGAAALLLLIAAGALLSLRPSLVTGAASGVVAALLVVGGVVVARISDEQEAAVTLSWTAGAFAAVAGFLLVTGPEVAGWPTCAAAGGVALVGAVAAVGIPARRAALVPIGLVGLMVAVASAVLALTDFTTGQVAAVTTVVAVLGSAVVPRLALESTTTRVPQAYTHDDLVTEPDAVDPTRVSADARRAHALFLGMSTTIGVLVAVLAPYVVGVGVPGTLLASCAAGVVMLRTRQYRVDSEVGVALGLGVLALAVIAASALLLHPEWRATLGLVLAGAGGLLLVATLVPLSPSVRRGRLVELVELALLVATLPLLVLSLGIV